MDKNEGDLKNEIRTVKEMMAKMYKLFKSKEVKERENENEGVEKRKETKETEGIKVGKNVKDKFKCEKCEFETNKKLTLKKHENTKHGNDEKRKGNEENQKTDKAEEKYKECE